MATFTTGSVSTYELIATVTSTGGPLSFTSIPQTYEHLILHAFPVMGGAPNSGGNIQLNGDTSLNYYGGGLYASNYMSFAYGFSYGTTNPNIGFLNQQGNGGTYYFPSYTSTNQKSVYSFGGSGNGFNRGGYSWNGTSAITQITFSATNHSAGTVFHLYGLKKV